MSHRHPLVRHVPCFIAACTSLPYGLSQTKAALFCLTFFESASPSSASAVPFAVVQGRVLCWSHHRRGLLPRMSGHGLEGMTPEEQQDIVTSFPPYAMPPPCRDVLERKSKPSADL